MKEKHFLKTYLMNPEQLKEFIDYFSGGSLVDEKSEDETNSSAPISNENDKDTAGNLGETSEFESREDIIDDLDVGTNAEEDDVNEF